MLRELPPVVVASGGEVTDLLGEMMFGVPDGHVVQEPKREFE